MRAKQVITPALKKSLGVKLARNVILVSLITGLLMGTFVTYRDLLATQHFFKESVQQVIKASSNPAARAAYNVSPELAGEVASGLMKYQAIISVTILDDLNNILTNRSQIPRYSPYRWIAKKGFGGLQSFEIELHIPGDPQVMVGYLEVIADPEHIAAEFVHRALSSLLIILNKNPRRKRTGYSLCQNLK